MSWLIATVQKLLQIGAFSLGGYRECLLSFVWVGKVPLLRDTGGAACQVSYSRALASYVIRKAYMIDDTSIGAPSFVREGEKGSTIWKVGIDK